MSDNILEKLSGYQIGYIGKDTGIAVDPEQNSLVLLSRYSISDIWVEKLFEISDLRSIEKVKMEADEHFSVGGRGGASAVGEGIAVAIRNSAEKRKAARQTGININLRSLELPTVFIPVPSDHSRDTLYEALSQLCENGKVDGRFNTIPIPISSEINENKAGASKGEFITLGLALAAVLVFVLYFFYA